MEISGRDNNLNLLRMLAALSVIYTHAFGLTGNSSSEPFLAMFGVGPGDVGVDVFFLVSGMLVTKSMIGRDLVQFLWARASRIYPGIWVSSVLLVLVAAFFWTPLDPAQFLRLPETIGYLFNNLALNPLTGAQMDLPFAFSETFRDFNVSLWTLPHELQMYALLTCIGILGGRVLRWGAPLLATSAATLLLVGSIHDYHLLGPDRVRFIYFFFVGSTIYLFRDRVTLRAYGLGICVAIVVAALALTSSHEVRKFALSLTLPYIALWFAFVPAGGIRRFNRLGDYSYGTYIYASPIQLCLAELATITNPLENLLWTILIVLPLAALSWHLVERPALKIPFPMILRKLQRRVIGRIGGLS